MDSSPEKEGWHGCIEFAYRVKYYYSIEKQERSDGAMVIKDGERLQELEGVIKEPFNFWQGKSPCWEMCHCPEDIKGQCPASKNTFLPCWEIEGTYLKLSDDGTRGDDLSICQVCRVYKRYGGGKPIEIKLKGKGLDTYCRNLQKKCQVR